MNLVAVTSSSPPLQHPKGSITAMDTVALGDLALTQLRALEARIYGDVANTITTTTTGVTTANGHHGEHGDGLSFVFRVTNGDASAAARAALAEVAAAEDCLRDVEADMAGIDNLIKTFDEVGIASEYGIATTTNAAATQQAPPPPPSLSSPSHPPPPSMPQTQPSTSTPVPSQTSFRSVQPNSVGGVQAPAAARATPSPGK